MVLWFFLLVTVGTVSLWVSGEDKTSSSLKSLLSVTKMTIWSPGNKWCYHCFSLLSLLLYITFLSYIYKCLVYALLTSNDICYLRPWGATECTEWPWSTESWGAGCLLAGWLCYGSEECRECSGRGLLGCKVFGSWRGSQRFCWESWFGRHSDFPATCSLWV